MKNLIALSALAGVVTIAHGQTLLTSLRTVNGAPSPTFVTHAPGDPAGRLFVVQRAGQISIHQNGSFLPTPFINLTGTVSLGNGEHGMFSMAFHPNYVANGYFYMMYTNGPTEDAVVARARRGQSSPNVADITSLEVILRIPQTATRERGGWIGFGPDGYLYVASGIGGVSNTGQILSDLRGKLLRIDVNGPDLQPGTADDDAFPADPNKLYHIPA
ncbi:MAG: PQQ-dependent sugar dehydrogenase, partial [Phycisphaerales bacterium]